MVNKTQEMLEHIFNYFGVDKDKIDKNDMLELSRVFDNMVMQYGVVPNKINVRGYDDKIYNVYASTDLVNLLLRLRNQGYEEPYENILLNEKLQAKMLVHRGIKSAMMWKLDADDKDNLAERELMNEKYIDFVWDYLFDRFWNQSFNLNYYLYFNKVEVFKTLLEKGNTIESKKNYINIVNNSQDKEIIDTDCVDWVLYYILKKKSKLPIKLVTNQAYWTLQNGDTKLEELNINIPEYIYRVESGMTSKEAIDMGLMEKEKYGLTYDKYSSRTLMIKLLQERRINRGKNKQQDN